MRYRFLNLFSIKNASLTRLYLILRVNSLIPAPIQWHIFNYPIGMIFYCNYLKFLCAYFITFLPPS
jgi:hypothetical protein